MRSITTALCFVTAIVRYNTKHRPHINRRHVAVLLALYLLDAHSGNWCAVTRIWHNVKPGILFNFTNRGLLKVLAELTAREQVEVKYSVSSGRKRTHYTLTISGLNLLNELERMTKAQKPYKLVR